MAIIKFLEQNVIKQQLHKTVTTIGLIKKSLQNNVIPTFAKVKGTLLREKHQQKCERDIMKSHLKKHQNDLSRVMKSISKDKDSMVNMIGVNFTLVLLKRISKEQYKHTIGSLQAKNRKLKRLIELKVKSSNISNFSVPVINLSSRVLTEKEQNHLKYDLKYCFSDRNKNFKKYLAAEL